MSEVIIILCTFPEIAKARQVGTLLVERQLAACVNLIPAAESIYRWEGNVETASETLAIFKSSQALFPEFQKVFSLHHPYAVPEIIALSPHQIAPPYLAWVLAQLATPRADQ